jgi:hypothetical protein
MTNIVTEQLQPDTFSHHQLKQGKWYIISEFNITPSLEGTIGVCSLIPDGNDSKVFIARDGSYYNHPHIKFKELQAVKISYVG